MGLLEDPHPPIYIFKTMQINSALWKSTQIGRPTLAGVILCEVESLH